MKPWKKIVLGLLLGFGAIQLVSFERTNPPVTADIRTTPELKAVLSRSCYDCHSNQTVWPWYSRVAPASWLLHRDVVEGRQALNFSDWESLPPDRQSKLKHEIADEVGEGDMPPIYYAPMHAGAALTTADKQQVLQWARGAEPEGE